MSRGFSGPDLKRGRLDQKSCAQGQNSFLTFFVFEASVLVEVSLSPNALNAFFDLNPVRKVKFFKEFNTGARIVSSEEEEKLIRNAAPFMQDLIQFGLNTGLRIGEIFSLRWPSVDMYKGILNILAQKTGKMRVVPLNAEARRVLETWAMGKKNDFVFYNHETGKPFVT